MDLQRMDILPRPVGFPPPPGRKKGFLWLGPGGSCCGAELVVQEMMWLVGGPTSCRLTDGARTRPDRVWRVLDRQITIYS